MGCDQVKTRMKPALVAIALLLVASGCTWFEAYSNYADPFIVYNVHLKDHSLKVIGVTGRIFGSTGRKVRLRTLSSLGGGSLQPIGFRATGPEGDPLPVKRIDDIYVVETSGSDFAFSYDVVLTVEDRYSPEIRSMLTFLDRDRCRLIGKDIFLLPELALADGIIVDFDLFPEGRLQTPWSINGTRMLLPSLEDLSLMMAVSGDYRLIEERIGSTEVCLAIAGEWSFRDEEFFHVIRSIIAEEITLFGSAPHDRYLFVCDRNPIKGGNKFEHYGVHFGAGMILLLDPHIDRSELFGGKMAIVAHEFFHNWNGEAIRADSDDMLWFTEGATVYYSYRVLLDAKIMTRDQYSRRYQSIRKRYLDNPYLRTVAIANSGNSDLADKEMVNLLYDGGFLAAEALDVELRDITSGRVRLIDVLRHLYEKGSILDEPSLLLAIEELCQRNLSIFISMMIQTPSPEILVEPSPAS